MIKQKVLIECDHLQKDAEITEKPIMVLFLPENEIHELGLLFVNYILLSEGYYTIFLGQSLPIGDLIKFAESDVDHIFVTNITVAPPENEIQSYIDEFHATLLKGNNHKLCLFGNLKGISNQKQTDQIELYQNYHDFISKYSKLSLKVI